MDRTSAPAQVVDQARSEAGSVVEEAKEQATQVAQEARSQAAELAGDAREQLRRQADEQTARVAESLRTVSTDLSSVSENIEHPDGAVAQVSRSLASSVERMAGRLEQRGVDGILDDVRRYARQNPTQFLLGAAALGFLAGRFFRNADMQAMAGSDSGGSGDSGGLGDEARASGGIDVTDIQAMAEIAPASSAVGGGVSTEPPLQAGQSPAVPGAGASVGGIDPMSTGGGRP